MAATVLLLLLAGLLVMGSTPTEGARFDWTLCKERLCLVNDGCSEISASKALVQHSDVTPCKVLLAIWPYSKNKWLVSFEANIASDGVSLRIIDDESKEKYSGVSCSRSNRVFAVTTKLTTYKTEFIRGSHAADRFTCEFFFETTNKNVLPDLSYNDKLELKYGTAATDSLKYRISLFGASIEQYEGLCNPDRIKFDQALAKPGQHLMPVNSDRFALTCPQDYDLIYIGASGASKVQGIKCVLQDAAASKTKHVYRITPLSGDVVDQLNKDFNAHCAQTVCSLCKPIDGCPPPTGSASSPPPATTCPSFAHAPADVDGACATLTCPGNRFSIDGLPATVSRAACTESGWRIGGRENVTRAACASTVSCQDVAPLTCSDGSCAVANGTLRCKDEGARLNTINGTRTAGGPAAVSVACDTATGIWRATLDNGDATNLTATPADYACGRVEERIVTGRNPWLKHLIAVGVIVSWIVGGLGLGKFFDRIHGLGDSENPRSTPELEALFAREDAKAAAAEKIKLEEASRQNASDPTTVTKPNKKTRSDRKKKTQPKTDKEDTKTAVAAPDAPAAPAAPDAPAAPPQPQQHSSLPRPQQNPATSSAEPDGYEPIPHLAEELAGAPAAAPAAPATQAARAASQPPASSGPDSGQYEEIPQDPAGPTPPPPPPPAAPKDDEYVMFEPTSSVPGPPPTPGAQSLQQPVQPSQLQQLQQQQEGAKPRASQYYANSTKDQ